MQRRKLVPLAMTGLALAGAAVFAVVDASTANAALTSNWYASAPYLMPFDNSPPDTLQVMGATGQKAFQLAFILAPNGGGCSPTWDGTRAVAWDSEAANLINRIRGGGGDVSVSIGGYGGTKLGQTCNSPNRAGSAAAFRPRMAPASSAVFFENPMITPGPGAGFPPLAPARTRAPHGRVWVSTRTPKQRSTALDAACLAEAKNHDTTTYRADGRMH